MRISCCSKLSGRGRSQAEIVAKIGVVEEEGDISTVWLDIIPGSKNGSKEVIAPLLNEAWELTAIFTAACKTAKQSTQNNSQNQFQNFPIQNLKIADAGK
ncbi:MAG: hypothetical protein ACXWV8_10955 [Chitinophagaceae bacterium]